MWCQIILNNQNSKLDIHCATKAATTIFHVAVGGPIHRYGPTCTVEEKGGHPAHSITPRLARFSFSESPKGRFSKWESQVWQMAELLSGPNPSAPPSSPEQAVSLKANIHLPTRIGHESKLAFTHTLDCCLGSRSWSREGHECKSLCSYTFAQLTIDCCPCRGRLQTHQRMQPKQIMHLLQLNSYQLPPCFWWKQRAMKYLSPQCWSIVGGQ